MKLGAISYLSLLIAFDGGTKPGWKLDENGNIVLKDGNPVYVNAAGKEMTVGGDTISNLNNEARQHREAKEAAEGKLEAFKGIDPVKAKDAIEKLGKIDQKTLIDAGEVERVREDVKKEFTTIIGEKDNALGNLQGRLDNMMINQVFSNSELLRTGIAVPRDMIEASLRGNFKIEDGKVVALGKDGNKLFSKTRSGEYADAEEAISILLESRADKDMILKAPDASGSGSEGGGSRQGGKRVVKRADFEKLTPVEQAETAAKAGKGELSIVE